MSFADHFSRIAGAYAAFRPRYPTALFDYLSSAVPRHDLAWDCATGNGQAALGLAERFTRVVATDASAQQIDAATPHPRIEYRVARAAQSGLEAGSVDVLTVAQALHWLDRAPFFAEARRVLAPGGVLAAWGYTVVRVVPAVDRILDRFYHDIVGPYWPPERRLVEDRYRTVAFPFAELASPEFAVEQPLTLWHLAGHLGTWSATNRYRQERGEDPVPAVVRELAAQWGPPETPRAARWPLFLRVGRR